MKTCTKCKTEKELSEFGVARGNPDGLNYWCKECNRVQAKKDYHNNWDARRAKSKEWHSANKDYRNAYRRERSKSPQVKKQLYEEKKRYREKHADELREKKAAYYMKNREREQAKARARYQDNPDYFKENARKRKNKLKSTVQEPYTKKQIYERDGGICTLCREPIDLLLKHPDPMCFSFDHTIPLNSLGHDTPDNVTSTHLVCNLKKGTAHL